MSGSAIVGRTHHVVLLTAHSAKRTKGASRTDLEACFVIPVSTPSLRGFQI